jgi:mRNA interferase HigB
VLNRDRPHFEVAGGNYRLIASFDFRLKIVFVKFIGTHAEYDAIRCSDSCQILTRTTVQIRPIRTDQDRRRTR